METNELIKYIHRRTGRLFGPEKIARYISDGNLTPDENPGRPFPNVYTVETANDFIRYLTAYTIKGAAKYMTKSLKWNVTTTLIKSICEEDAEDKDMTADERIYISKPFRIPSDNMPILKARLIESRGIRRDITQGKIDTCLLLGYTLTDLADKCGISLSMMSRVNDGKRKMTAEVYDKLLELSQGDTDGE